MYVPAGFAVLSQKVDAASLATSELPVRGQRKPRPHGGLDATANNLAFYLTGHLVDVPRREVAKRALDISFARHTTITAGGVPIINDADPICAKTKEHFYGAALAALLSSRALLDYAQRLPCKRFGSAFCTQLASMMLPTP